MDLIEEFERFEEECSLFDVKIDNVPVWERVRKGVFDEIKQQSGAGQAYTSVDLDVNDQIEGAKLWAKNLFYRNPYLAPESDFLFVGHPRRKEQPDGYWWDLYCDPLHEHCSLDSVHFEMPYLLDHRSPAKTDSLRYLEFIHYSGTILRKLGLCNFALSTDERSRVEDIEMEVRRRFDTEVSLADRILRHLQNRRCRLGLYKRLLGRVDPAVAVVVVSYGNHLFVEACKQEGVPVVEVQHGVIHPYHLGYSFPGDRTKTVFPDYLLTWGEFWSDNMELPIPDERVIPVGYPHFEQSKNQYENFESRNQIIFISQGSIGKQLSKFALNVDRHSAIDHDVVYKLHPKEYDHWQEKYPWLVDADFEVIDSSEPPLYELFAESHAQVGVYSTAIYEGLAFDLDTYIYDCSESDVMDPLIREGSAKLVSSADELTPNVGETTYSFDSEYYFSSNAVENVCDALRHLAEEGKPYNVIPD